MFYNLGVISYLYMTFYTYDTCGEHASPHSIEVYHKKTSFRASASLDLVK